MTISPIAVQVPMNEIFNDTSCYFHWATMVILPYHMAIGGFGMAIFRVGCIHNLFSAQKDPKEVSKIILVSELAILGLLSTINCSGKVIHHCNLTKHTDFAYDFRSDVVWMGKHCLISILHGYGAARG